MYILVFFFKPRKLFLKNVWDDLVVWWASFSLQALQHRSLTPTFTGQGTQKIFVKRLLGAPTSEIGGDYRFSVYLSITLVFLDSDMLQDIKLKLLRRPTWGVTDQVPQKSWLTYLLPFVCAKQFRLMDWWCPSVRPSVNIWLTFAFKFLNLLCNLAIPSSAVSCSISVFWTFLAHTYFQHIFS